MYINQHSRIVSQWRSAWSAYDEHQSNGGLQHHGIPPSIRTIFIGSRLSKDTPMWRKESVGKRLRVHESAVQRSADPKGKAVNEDLLNWYQFSKYFIDPNHRRFTVVMRIQSHLLDSSTSWSSECRTRGMDFLVLLIKPNNHHSLKKKSSQRRCTSSRKLHWKDTTGVC